AVGWGVVPSGDTQRVAVRIPGAADRKRLAALLGKDLRGPAVKELKGPRGESITLLGGAGRGPAFALVGDSDLLAASFEGKGKSLDVLEQVLQVRAGRQKGAPGGPLAALVKEAPANARAVVAYDLPEKAVSKMARGTEPLPALPRRLLAYLTPGAPGDTTKEGKLTVPAQGTMKDAAEARAFVAAAERLKQQGLKVLRDPPPQAKIPPQVVKGL